MRIVAGHEDRARASKGVSNSAIYSMVERVLSQRNIRGDLILDVGCGTGSLRAFVRGRFARYVGADAVRYAGFPADAEFHAVNLDGGRVPLPDGCADVVAAVETIEHLENPRAFMRELVRLAKPDGWVVATTPNQLSLLSLLTLLVKGRFAAFQECDYPAHLTALLEVDLRRIGRECGLADVAVAYSQKGRLIFSARHYPAVLSRMFPKALSDNLLMIGRRPD